MTINVKPLSTYYDGEHKTLLQQFAAIESAGKALSAELDALRLLAADDTPVDDSEARMQSLLNGAELPDRVPYGKQIQDVLKRLKAVDESLNLIAGKLRAADSAANDRLLADIKLDHDIAAKRLAQAMYEAHEAHAVLFRAKRELLNNSLTVRSLFQTDVEEFIGLPGDKTSDLAYYLRDCVERGYLKSVPRSMAA